MNWETIVVEIDDVIGWIKINRPEVRNALNERSYEEIDQAINLFNANENILAVIITGEGEKSFAAGADIKQLQSRKAHDVLIPGLQGICRQIEQSPKIYIAAVNGFALGGGCELALACDIRIGAEHAKFGLPELNLAIIPSGGGTQRLARTIGKGRALDMILTGKIIDAYKAEQYGLVSLVVPQEQLLEQTVAYIQQIVSKGPLALRLAKQVVHQGYDLDLNSALTLEKLAQAILYESEDKVEGTTAFIEKRPAYFMGR